MLLVDGVVQGWSSSDSCRCGTALVPLVLFLRALDVSSDGHRDICCLRSEFLIGLVTMGNRC